MERMLMAMMYVLWCWQRINAEPCNNQMIDYFMFSLYMRNMGSWPIPQMSSWMKRNGFSESAPQTLHWGIAFWSSVTALLSSSSHPYAGPLLSVLNRPIFFNLYPQIPVLRNCYSWMLVTFPSGLAEPHCLPANHILNCVEPLAATCIDLDLWFVLH